MDTPTFAGGSTPAQACTNGFAGIVLGPSQHYNSGNYHVYQYLAGCRTE